MYILDTNIITAFLKDNQKVKQRVQEVTVQGNEIFINGISYYEIKRGLLASNATRQLGLFELLCKTFGILLLNNLSIFDGASDLYANLQQKGMLIGDADILIASLTKIQNFILVTDDSHFQRVQGLRTENWLT
jgi:tRNA(fMet)-specific endonuclease VapC